MAGGLASRLGGRPKGLIEIGGRRMLDRVADLLTAVTGTFPYLVANAADAGRWRPELPLVRDALTGAGALGGIHAALAAAPGASVLCVAWDLPFITAPLLSALLEGLSGVDACVPESGGPRGLEPLCAAYGPACRSAIERRVAAGDLRAIAFHDDVRVGTLPLARVRTFGDPARLFFNVNTPEDVERAERAWPPPG
ncbi:MAG TPA: molybdenum cofactor guanylyltransferase [Gemmatimonadales bacterium]|nr:molybdenum cofactor guanylyltransferase [Gemmatimonadales bacterium]